MTQQQCSDDAEPYRHTCGHCRREFRFGIHVGRNVNRKQARYASYCSVLCKNLGEMRFEEQDRRIRNQE